MSHSHARISPTAHYTGHVWVRNGLSPAWLASRRGALFHAALAPASTLARGAFGGHTLDSMLLDRHLAIDAAVEAALRAGATRVVEIAAGLGGRSLRLAERFPGVRFVDGDLPDMAAARSRALARAGAAPPNVRVVTLDFLAADGPTSLLHVLADEVAPTVVVTEGLLNYLPRGAVEQGWAAVATALRSAGGGTYISDLHLGDEVARFAAAHWFMRGLGVFARGRTELHHATVDEALAAARAAGFDTAEATAAHRDAARPVVLRVLQATVAPSG